MKTSYNLILLKFDYKSKQNFTILDSVYDHFYLCKVIIDQSNENKFLICSSSWFAIGSLDEDKIVFGPFQQFNIGDLTFRMLIGNEMHGFDSEIQNDADNQIIKYRKVDLIKLTEETIEVPLVLNDGRAIYDFKVDILLLFLILSKFRLIHIAGLERDCIPSLVIKIIGYFNYLFILSTYFRHLLSHSIRKD
jgi:hypothetical protein